MRYCGITESTSVRCGVRSGELVMKVASFENALTFATIALFVVFLVWGVKIIVA